MCFWWWRRPFYGVVIMKPRKTVWGVGINDADYVVKKQETIGYLNGKLKQKMVWICPYYQAWKEMLRRCYSAKYQETYPTYKGCSVSEKWLALSNFRAWMEKQDFEGMHLDKDILFKGNKVYSAETCVFVAPLVNAFINDQRTSRGECLLGACLHKPSGNFKSQCNNPFTKKYEHLGFFTCEQEAHEAWRKRKLELAHELAAIQTDPRVATALIDRYSKPQLIGE